MTTVEKLVSIIIPFYRVSQQRLDTVLTSINNQIGIDFQRVEVILVNDGGPQMTLPVAPVLQFTVRMIQRADNQGAGVARQAGMDVATGRYYMFVDADDQLQNVNALETFFRAVQFHGDRDILISKYLEQLVDDERGGYRYVVHRNHNWTAPVAKWFNRAFIDEVGLRWRDDLRVFEDTYFVGLACDLAEHIYYMDDVTYVWLHNAQSTVRQNDGAFTSQLHVWARMNHAYLDMIAMQLPARLLATFGDYVADSYLRTQKYVAADPAAFEREHQQLMVAYEDLWPQVKTQLKHLVTDIIETSGEFGDGTTFKLRAFIKQQDQLYQAHQKNTGLT